MTICVLADEQLKLEFTEKGIPENVHITWADTLKVMNSVSDIDVYFDLLFYYNAERMSELKKLRGKPVFVNAINETLSDIDQSFIRINAWPTMLKRSITEISIYDPGQSEIVADIFNRLQWKYIIAPDIPGMITPRVVAMIINEAYFALEQNVSSKEEIDIAMKLGTNYPMGPFEWGKKIGIKNVYSLLHALSFTDERYRPSEMLTTEANIQQASR